MSSDATALWAVMCMLSPASIFSVANQETTKPDHVDMTLPTLFA